MVEKFEVGKWYVCGARERPPGWNAKGLMDALLDGKPHRCISADGLSAMFTDTLASDYHLWSFWSSRQFFTEVPAPTDEVHAPPRVGTNTEPRTVDRMWGHWHTLQSSGSNTSYQWSDGLMRTTPEPPRHEYAYCGSFSLPIMTFSVAGKFTFDKPKKHRRVSALNKLRAQLKTEL